MTKAAQMRERAESHVRSDKVREKYDLIMKLIEREAGAGKFSTSCVVSELSEAEQNNLVTLLIKDGFQTGVYIPYNGRLPRVEVKW